MKIILSVFAIALFSNVAKAELKFEGPATPPPPAKTCSEKEVQPLLDQASLLIKIPIDCHAKLVQLKHIVDLDDKITDYYSVCADKDQAAISDAADSLEDKLERIAQRCD